LVFYSRLELERADLRHIRDPEIPSVDAVIVVEEKRTVRCFALHPAPPAPKYAEETDQRDAELLMVAEEIREREDPVLVFGDLNDVAWSPTTRLFQKVSELLDPRIGRGQYNTFHASYPLLRYPLDHIFVSTHFRLHRLERLPFFGSDHFPIFAEFQLTSSRNASPEEPEDAPKAEIEDLQEAENVIETADRKLSSPATTGEAVPARIFGIRAAVSHLRSP